MMIVAPYDIIGPLTRLRSPDDYKTPTTNTMTTNGREAEGYIHVHHLRGLSDVGGEYVVDPVNDLRPVCPNCHAVLAGDAIQDILSTHFQSIVGETHCLNYSSEFARRAMADLALLDQRR